MENSTSTIIEGFKTFKAEFNNAEKRIRKLEVDKTQTSNAMVFTVSSKYISGVLKQLEDFEERWKRVQCEERYSNVENYQIFDRLLERTLRRLETYFRAYDSQSRSTYLALIRHTRAVIAAQHKLFEKLCSNANSLAFDSNNLLNYEYELKNREIDSKTEIASASAVGSRQLQDSFVSVEKRYPIDLLDNYLAGCVQFHSHIQVFNLFDNTDDFLNRVGSTVSSDILQSEQRQILESELNIFKIPLCMSPSMFAEMTFKLSQEYPSDDVDAHGGQSFYPSEDPQILNDHKEVISVLEALRIHRWLVCLGEPGSRKTILAQYLTRRFAECLQQRQYGRTVIDGIDLGPHRVPILIRVGEFVQWLEQHPNSELIDYIGLNTWCGKQYSPDNVLSEMLTDFVQNGHALIIIDGLDEVATINNRQRVVELVKNFMRIHAYSAEFVSPFDKKYTGDASVFTSQYSDEDADVLAEIFGADTFDDICQSALQRQQHQWQCESSFEGNLLIVTSRVAGYNTTSLFGDRIAHCTILPFTTDTAKDFVKTWCKDVQNKVQSLISLIDVHRVSIGPHCWPRSEDILAMLENIPYREKMPTTNPLLLSIICVMYARQCIDSMVKTRVELYEEMVNLAIRKWLANQAILGWNELRVVLANLGIYMQWRSSTGLIDEFDLEQLCSLTLQQVCKTNTKFRSKSDIRRRTGEFIRLLNEDMGVAAARSLCVYGFIHLSFQEYFAALYLTERLDFFCIRCNPITLASLFCRLFGQRRMREVLLLAMGRISLKWPVSDYNHFCNCLVSTDNGDLFNKHVPSGSILLLTAFNDVVRLPMASSIHTALDVLLDIHGHWGMRDECEHLLLSTMRQLPDEVVYGWFEKVFTSDIASRLKILHFFWSTENHGNLKELPKWFNAEICDLFSKQLGMIAGNDGEVVDFYIEKFLILVSTGDPHILPNPTSDLKDYLIKHPTASTRANPRVFAAIIALFGGLQRPVEYEDNDGKKTVNTTITFSPQHMHRTSPLSYLFIQYFDDESQSNEEKKLQRLTDQCQILLCKNTSTRLEIIHGYVVLLSLLGINEVVTNRLKVVDAERLTRHMKLTLYYLRNFYCMVRHSGFKEYAGSFLINTINATNDECTNINYAYLIANASIQLTYFEEGDVFDFSDAIGSGERNIPASSPFFTIKISDAAYKRPDVNRWDETTVFQFLAFVYYIPPRLKMSFEASDDDSMLEDIRTLESGDINLLKNQIKHPFQLFEEKPFILMLAFFPKHLQPLYGQLFSANTSSLLPFAHFLIEFLFHAAKLEPYTLRFCILITILLPVFQEHKMENLLLTFIRQCDGDKNYLKKTSKDSFCQPFTKILLKKQQGLISSQATIEDAIEEERRRISIASNMINGSHQLYVSSICLARLTQALDKKTKVSVTTMINEALAAAKKLENPLWRLDALLAISGCPDTTSFESRDSISELENALDNSTPLLASVALIVRCLLTSKTKFQPKRLFDKIFEQLSLQSDDEQQGICEALIHFPSLHLRVCHFINQKTRWRSSDNIDVFSRIFQLHSSAFSTAFLSTHSSSLLYQTLSTSMYLAELSVDIIKLEEWLIKETDTDDPIRKLAEKCLHALHQNEFFLSTKTVCDLSTYFAHYAKSSISFTDEDHANLHALERECKHKRLEDVESASHPVIKWLTYDHHPLLFHCAHMGAVLLAQSGIGSPEIIEKCCELLISKEYCDCPRRSGIIIASWQRSDKKLFEILLKCLIREDYVEHLPIHIHRDLVERLAVQSSEELQLLIDTERRKHQITINKQNASTSQWSLFDLIDTWPTDAPQHFMNVLLSLTDPTEYSFLSWLLEHLPTALISSSSERKRFCEYLLRFLSDELTHVSLKLAIVRCLSYYQEDDRVRTALWDIIINNNNNQIKDHDLVSIACLRSLYWRRQVDLNEEELKQLDLLRKSSLSSFELQQAALTGLYMHMIKEPNYYCVFDVYFSYMRNIGDDNDEKPGEEEQDKIVERASHWIICHRSVLLARFVDDLCKCLSPLQTDFYSYIYVADLVCVKIREEFCDAIRQSVVGENCFKNYLCIACRTNSKENNNKHIVHCVQVYAGFQQFTCDYASMLLKVKDDELFPRLSSTIPLLIISREAIDYLLNIINSASSSDYERYRAAQLLLNLEEYGYVSTVEIQETIVSAIENFGAEDKQSDCNLKWLLSEQMLYELYNPEQSPKLFQSPATSIATTLCSSAPAIVFLDP